MQHQDYSFAPILSPGAWRLRPAVPADKTLRAMAIAEAARPASPPLKRRPSVHIAATMAALAVAVASSVWII